MAVVSLVLAVLAVLAVLVALAVAVLAAAVVVRVASAVAVAEAEAEAASAADASDLSIVIYRFAMKNKELGMVNSPFLILYSTFNVQCSTVFPLSLGGNAPSPAHVRVRRCLQVCRRVLPVC